MIDHLGHNLIFILSLPRAGSTLLGSILGNHNQTFCPSEPWLLLPLSVLRSDDAAIISPYDHELAREGWRQWVTDDLHMRASNAFAVTVYNALLEQAGKQMFIDKTPRYYHILPWLERLFPQAIKIWLKRNPLDVIVSCRETWDIRVEELTGYVTSPRSFDNTVGLALLAAYFEEKRSTQYTLRYEDLVQDAATHVKALCDFAGLTYEEGMLNYGANRDLMQMHSEKTMGDKKILEHARPHVGSVGRWRDALSPQEIRKVLWTLGRGVFDRLGYADVFEEAAQRADLDPAKIGERGNLDALFRQYAAYAEQGLFASGSVQHTRAVRENARLRAYVTEIEADRAKRLQVIEQQGQQFDQLQGERDRLQSERDQLQAGLAEFQRLSQTIQSGRVYKAVRRLGGWGWVERSLARLLPGKTADVTSEAQHSANR